MKFSAEFRIKGIGKNCDSRKGAKVTGRDPSSRANARDLRKISPVGRNDNSLSLRAWRLGAITFSICCFVSPLHFLLQSLQRAQDQLTPEGFFLFRRKLGIARRTDNAARRNSAHRADFLRYRDHRADLRDWNFQFFDFFADRCAAACAGASRRGENDASDSGGLEARGDPLTDVRRVVHCRVSAACRVHELMELADHAFSF